MDKDQNAGCTMRGLKMRFSCISRRKKLFACNFLTACVTHKSMRNWMRERMKRRKKKPENETEATGKVGQQKPVVDESHPQPLTPAYDEIEPEAGMRGCGWDSSTTGFCWPTLPVASVSFFGLFFWAFLRPRIHFCALFFC